jgi:transcription initiation factor TFIIIB Brf1 subunit/transcription initiation factor TFIIB
MTSERRDAERSPEQIQAEIEATRAEMGETVAAVAEKADVKKQAKQKVEEIKEQASTKAEHAPSLARENPIPLAAVGIFIAGIVFGRMSRH